MSKIKRSSFDPQQISSDWIDTSAEVHSYPPTSRHVSDAKSQAFFSVDAPPSGGRRSASKAQRPFQPPFTTTLLFLLQLVVSGAAFYQLCRTRMLPPLYLLIACSVLVLFLWLFLLCRRHRLPCLVATLFSSLLCIILTVGCVFAQQGLSALASITSGLTNGSEAAKIATAPFVIYLSGVDTRGELTESARSDVNILAVVHPVTKQVVLINTPRDYYIDLAGTDRKDKLTHAGLYGVDVSMKTLADLYDVQVDYFMRINFAGFMNIVDALGGVDVYSDYTFTSVGSPGYYDPTDFTEGMNHLDGQAALAFARERYAFSSGDIQRGINQMKVIQAILDKLKSPAVLLGYSHLMEAISDCFITNLSSDQIAALVRMQLNDTSSWTICSYSVTGSNGSSTKCYSAQGQKLYVMLPNQDSVQTATTMIQEVMEGTQEEGTASSANQ